KRILRDAMHELPDAVRWRRQKNGFSSPDAGYWATQNGRMRAMIDDALDLLAPLVDTGLVRRRLDALAATTDDYDEAMFRLISLSAWVRAFDVSL
ncbi:MAG TPA: asparagine synthase-related protein, partial [Sphingopyxis sp.]|nr:asparagine synthase-related protein [Sphingopyxis sp.]